jgi:hypothetical protein
MCFAQFYVLQINGFVRMNWDLIHALQGQRFAQMDLAAMLAHLTRHVRALLTQAKILKLVKVRLFMWTSLTMILSK